MGPGTGGVTGQVEVWSTYATTSPGSITVTDTATNSATGMLVVRCYTNADPASPVVATSFATGAGTISGTLATTRNNSLVAAFASDTGNTVTPDQHTPGSAQTPLDTSVAASVWTGAWVQTASTAASGTPVAMNIAAAGTSGCPCSMWTSATTPANFDTSNVADTLGVRFTTASNGSIGAIRIYRPAGNNATQVKLWTATGTLLGTATIAGSGTGWVTGTFTTPINVTAATTYVATYYTSTGHAAYNAMFFNSPITNGPITMPATTTADGNGLYLDNADAFPTDTWNANNYWIDPVFTPTNPSSGCPCTMWTTATTPA